MIPAETAARTQRLALTLIVLAGVVNYIDRSSLAIASGSIRSQLHFSGTQIGILLSAFSLAYGIAQLPIGPLLDRVGGLRVLRIGLGVWSVAQLLTGMAGGMLSFVPLRVLLGIGEAPFFPAAMKVVREQFPEGERGRATAAVNISSTAGQAIAPPLLTIVMLLLGWRMMFVSLGVLGIALVGVWFLVQPQQNAATDDVAPTLPRQSFEEWLTLFRLRAIWGLMLGFGGINFTVWFYMGWLPTYLQRDRGVSIYASGWMSAVPFLAGSLGMLVSGVLADRADRAGVPIRKVHRRQILFGMVASSVATLLVASVASATGAVICISAALFFIHFAGTSGWGLVQAASPPSLVGSISSIQNFGSMVIASLSPAATGWLLDKTRSFSSAFLLCGSVTLLGMLCYLLLVRINQETLLFPQVNTSASS